MTIEEHPLQPFLPENGRVLFLGSFPPPRARWSMEFFYPNWINDFWRIQGLIHFGDKQYFEIPPALEGVAIVSPKKFDKEKIVRFCNEQGFGFFDTARKVCRLKDNASDDHLEILEGTDVFELLSHMPCCHTIVTTGGKASEELCHYFEQHNIVVNIPKVGEYIKIFVTLRSSLFTYTWYRMPSTSRAYPMKLEKKAEYYKSIKY